MDKLVTSTDISVLLNVHREHGYLQRTLRSLTDAMSYAFYHGITSELVIVLDKSDAKTEAAIAAFPFASHALPVIKNVEFGCLGSSRNAGIELAGGEYLATADADDLVSYNYLDAMYRTAKASGPANAFFPKYYFGFGDSYHLCEYHGTDVIPKTLLFSVHPYVSRVFALSEVFRKVGYTKTPAHGPYAYEDWHFNCELLARGYEFVAVANVAVYYRKRDGSMLKNANENSLRCIPPSKFFEPDVYVALYEGQGLEDNEINKNFQRSQIKQNFENDLVNMELLHVANTIDASVFYNSRQPMSYFNYVNAGVKPAEAYYNVCKKLGTRQFTDIFLVPFLVIGGGDKYVIEVMKGISALDEGRRILVLGMQNCPMPQWLDHLPDSAAFLDVFDACSGLEQESVDLVTLRIIQTHGRSANLFLKSAESTLNFYRKYRAALTSNPTTYFRFMDNRFNYSEMSWRHSFDFEFLSNCGQDLSKIVTDNEAVTKLDMQSFAHLASKTHFLYAPCAAPGHRPDAKPTTRKLLWASRLDFQKRPDRLISIASELLKIDQSVAIDVYGSTVLQVFDIGRFDNLPNLTYCGPYSSFDSIITDDYSGFLYTSDFDGLPNVVLEAMGRGLPIIASNIGGVAEAVNGTNGFLVPWNADEQQLVSSYVAAIVSLFELGDKLVSFREAATETVHTRHSWTNYLSQLDRLFGVSRSKQISGYSNVT